MKYFITLIIFFFLLAGCKQKVLTGVALQNKLIETMHNYLDTTLAPDAHFTVKDVAFYPEAEHHLYNCRFHVRMQYKNSDTTGIVIASITNDFKTIVRTQ
ncbi:MAG: hypothetical protein KGM16_03925 [Bacteroidota bacterium]|nr:hypothetical protein [Bacteroidota bacterium]